MHTRNFLFAILIVHCSLTMVGCTQNAENNTTKNIVQPLVTLEKPLERLTPDLLSNLGRADLFEPLIVIDNNPKPDETPTATLADGTPAPVTVDPFQDIKLNGLFYGKKGKSVAILKTADDKASVIVAQGESFASNADSAIRIKVSQVTNDMVVLTSGKQKKVLKIDNLVGFRSSASATSSDTTPTAPTTATSNTQNSTTSQSAPLSGGLANHL